MTQYTRKVLQVGVLLMALMVTGCATTINPDDHEWRDVQEDGPKQGLFSGSKGEFVIYKGKIGER